MISLAEFTWTGSPTARALARAFTPPPDMEIWEWADENVMLQNEDAAEPGEYRSAKTPWTRRLQELTRNPFMLVWNYTGAKWQRVPVHEVSVQKSSQSGFSEACLNGIRWRATYRPCNVIYAIDSADEGKKIARRLLRSFKFLDQSIFTGDPDDIKTLEFKLRGMELFFYGSFTEGKFANKQAPLRIADEVEEHGGKGTLDNLDSRGKGAAAGGLQLNLSKPKLKDGPINRAFLAGNQEEFFVPCPHCKLMQPLTFFSEERDVTFSEEIDEIRDEQTGEILGLMPRPLPLGEKRKMKTGRMVFDHCRNLLGQWDQLRILNDTYYECANPACVADGAHHGRISEGSKRWMIDRGAWRPMVLDGSPGVVSQHFNDLYSEDDSVAWGRLVIRWLKLKREGTEGMKTFYNHYLGKVWSETASATTTHDILANIAGKTLWFVDSQNSEGQPVRNVFTDEASAIRHSATSKTPVLRSACPPYKRETIPFRCYRQSERASGTLLLGADVGLTYTRWAVLAVAENLLDMAVIDWGTELHHTALLQLVQQRKWKMADGSGELAVIKGFIDAHWDTTEVYKTCLASRGLFIPTQHVGGAAAQNVRLWNYTHVPTYAPSFKQLVANKQRAHDALYIERIQKKRKRLWFPVDVEEDQDFIDEMCGEEQEEDKRGRMVWKDPAPRPNHSGDAVGAAVTGLGFLTRALQPETADAGAN